MSVAAVPCTCQKDGSFFCKFPHPCRRCRVYHPGISCYWAARERTIEEAAKAVCPSCKSGYAVVVTKGGFFHDLPHDAPGESWPYRCRASAIRALSRPASTGEAV
jgi:hypothetical protein